MSTRKNTAITGVYRRPSRTLLEEIMGIESVLKSAGAEGKEKHVPVITVVDDGTVRVVVGDEIEHPNTLEHHIAWVSLYGVVKGKKLVINLGRTEFAAGYTKPEAVFKVNVADFEKCYAVAYCNLHGIWESEA
jgi:superoxide reductase